MPQKITFSDVFDVAESLSRTAERRDREASECAGEEAESLRRESANLTYCAEILRIHAANLR